MYMYTSLSKLEPRTTSRIKEVLADPYNYYSVLISFLSYPWFWCWFHDDGRQTPRCLDPWSFLDETSNCGILHLLGQPLVLHLDPPTGKMTVSDGEVASYHKAPCHTNLFTLAGKLKGIDIFSNQSKKLER